MNMSEENPEKKKRDISLGCYLFGCAGSVLLMPVLLVLGVLSLRLGGPLVNEALLGFPERQKYIVKGYDYQLVEDIYTDVEPWYTFTSKSHDYRFEELILFQALCVQDGYLYFDGDGLHRIHLESGAHESLKQLPQDVELIPVENFFKTLPLDF